MHQLRNIFCIAIIIGTTACTQKRDFGGDRMTNYPDLNLIAKDYLLNYEKNPYTFLKISIEKGKKDSSYVKANDINWKEINELFSEANLYNEKYEKQYSITVISDTLNPLMTLIYTGINPQNLVQKLSIIAENFDSKIRSVYWEINDEGFFNSKQKKVLYVVGKTLQIQQYTKNAFEKEKRKIIQYNFLN